MVATIMRTVRDRFGEHGRWNHVDLDFHRMTATDDHLAVLTDWAHHYPSARFVVVAVAEDESDAAPLGWGIALPDLAFTCLPEIKVTGQLRTAHELVDILGPSLDIRIIWVDPEPEYWPPDED